MMPGMPHIEASVRLNFRRARDMLRQDRQLRKAARAMPKPLPWEFARPRLMPLLAGPYLGDIPLVTVVAPIGCAVNFGVEIAGTFVLVDRPVAQRWECSDDQLREAAWANLRQRASRLTPADLRHATFSGRIVRVLDRVPWATSLVFAEDELVRLFGESDQVFGVPRRDTVLAFGFDVPERTIADIVVDFEADAAYPLMLDPFVRCEGQLLWSLTREEEMDLDGFEG